MMPSIIIQLDQHSAIPPCGTVSGTYRLVEMRPEEVLRLEFSVLWFTEGKGDEDLGVHHFESIARDSGEVFQTLLHELDTSQMIPFHVALPPSPLSYYGKILKIHWCVRVRLYLKSGHEINGERLFTVGNIPPVQVSLD